MTIAGQRRIAISLVVFTWLTFTISRVAAQQIIHVPADVPTITQAISAAQNGDTVLVSPGTYFETVNFQGKAITVASSDGPATTILDGNNANGVVFFVNGEGLQSILKGFTITHGASPSSGSGISILESSATIDGNTITANQGCEGIGISVRFGSAVIKNNVITNNTASFGCSAGGGGIELNNASNVQVLNNVVSGNLMFGNGGGIEISSSTGTIVTGNTVQNNTANGFGGGISIENDSQANLAGNLVTGNTAFLGGGIYWIAQFGSQNLVVNNTVASNTGLNDGQEFWIEGYFDGTQFFNNLIVDNTGNGAISCSSAVTPPSFVSNDIVSIQPGPPPQLVPAINGSPCVDVTGVNGNLQQDPLFVNSSGNDYHLQASSPAIDAGNNSAPSLPDKDLDGKPRIGPGNASTCAATVDMGAYEFALNASGAAQLSPSSLVFPGNAVGTSSVPQSASIFVFQGCVQVASVTATGDYSQTNNCGSALSSSNSCTIQVTFTPTAGGLRTGSLTVDFGSSATSQSTSLMGQGLVSTPPSYSPTSLEFGDQLVSSTSAAQTVTVFGGGNVPLQISSVSITGDYVQTNSCVPMVAPTCLINVSFSPTATGSRPGTMIINTNEGSVTVTMSGTGTVPTYSPTTLAFGNQPVSSTSASQTVTVFGGGSPIQISSVSITGDYVQTNSCVGLPIAAPECLVNVSFSPTATGSRPGTMVINTNLGSFNVTMSGTGIAPQATLSTTNVTFPNQLVNTSSAPQTITLSNTGTAALQVTSISVVGAGGSGSNGFAQTNNCGSSLAPGANCAISVTFTPAALGGLSAVLTVNSNAPSVVANLSGTGIAAVGTVSPQSLTFGNQLVQTASPAQAVTLTNTGNIALAINNIAVTGDFTQTNTCGASLAAGASCTISVTFVPTARLSRVGSLTIQSNSTPPAPSVSLSGTGIAPVAMLTASVNFGFQDLHTSATQSATLTNPGELPLTISSITTSGGSYSQSNACGASLAAGSSCMILVNFNANATGPITGSLTVTDNDPAGGTQVAALTGTGVDFAVSSSPSSVTVTQGQTAGYTISVATLGGNFPNNVSLSCSGLPRGATCSFSPTSVVPGTSSTASQLSITTTGQHGSQNTPKGSHSIKISGVSDSLKHSISVTLVVD
jgi:parallel beta-helix repeat protein